MSEWLEDYLTRYKGTLLMVTHDRYFLDEICDRIVELDQGKLYSYKANYAGYLELKAERMDIARAKERTRQNILRNELKWVMRGAKARTTKHARTDGGRGAEAELHQNPSRQVDDRARRCM